MTNHLDLSAKTIFIRVHITTTAIKHINVVVTACIHRCKFSDHTVMIPSSHLTLWKSIFVCALQTETMIWTNWFKMCTYVAIDVCLQYIYYIKSIYFLIFWQIGLNGLSLCKAINAAVYQQCGFKFRWGKNKITKIVS
jgi:hypothetical protein